MGIYIIFIVFALISFAVQKMLQAKFDNYSKVPIPNGLTGKDIAEKMGVSEKTVKNQLTLALKTLKSELSLLHYLLLVLLLLRNEF